MESKEMALMNLFSRQQWRNRHREQTMDMEGGVEGEGEMYGDRNIEIYNTRCKIDTNENLLCASGNSNRSSVTG